MSWIIELSSEFNCAAMAVASVARHCKRDVWVYRELNGRIQIEYLIVWINKYENKSERQDAIYVQFLILLPLKQPLLLLRPSRTEKTKSISICISAEGASWLKQDSRHTVLQWSKHADNFSDPSLVHASCRGCCLLPLDRFSNFPCRRSGTPAVDIQA